MNATTTWTLTELNEQSHTKRGYIPLSILLALTMIGIWDLILFREGPMQIVGIAGLLTEIVVVTWWIKNQRKQKMVASRTVKHYISRLKSAESLQDRQKTLDDMVALDILSNINMSGLDLSDMHLVHAKLNNTDLSLSKFKGVELSDASLRGANLSYATLLYATLRYTEMQDANLTGASFKSSDLSSARLLGANLRAASLNDCNLAGADLRNANLRHADLRNANLTNALLTNADLRHCVLPDGNMWSPSTDMTQFTQREHPLVEMFFAKTPIRKLMNSDQK